MAAAAAAGKSDRLLRTYRAAIRIQSRRNVDARVEKGMPGYKAWDVHGKYSLRASVTSGLAMTDCKVPAGNLLPGVEGLKGPLSCLNQARYGIGWGGIGAGVERKSG